MRKCLVMTILLIIAVTSVSYAQVAGTRAISIPVEPKSQQLELLKIVIMLNTSAGLYSGEECST